MTARRSAWGARRTATYETGRSPSSGERSKKRSWVARRFVSRVRPTTTASRSATVSREPT
jgi:hypothetical protein